MECAWWDVAARIIGGGVILNENTNVDGWIRWLWVR